MTPRLFYLETHQMIHAAMVELRAAQHAVDLITVGQKLKDIGRLDDIGGLGYLSKCCDDVPSVFNFPTYRDTLEQLRIRRDILTMTVRAKGLARDVSIDPAEFRREFASILDLVARDDRSHRPRLVIRKASERREYTPPPGTDLVGTAEIRKGHEGLTILAGPGSSGKSLLVGTLALAGALGKGTWMGRKVHRRFKTLIIQGEVGPSRLRSQMIEFARLHPEADVEGTVFYSDPPEGGFAIADTEFWTELRRQVEELKPDLVVIDPISHLSVVDDASEVMNAIRVIRQAIGVGDSAPGILLVAHTKKPRSEESMRGRNLAHCVSGSVTWVNTSRCTYLCVPFEAEDIEDDRIYFATPKINDGPNYAPTVWKRRFGTFFDHDPATDPTTWGKDRSKEEVAEERQKITFAHLQEAFGTRPGMKRRELVQALKDQGHDEATCYRATGKDGYLKRFLTEAAGVVALRKP
jgi:hypothetical protein